MHNLCTFYADFFGFVGMDGKAKCKWQCASISFILHKNMLVTKQLLFACLNISVKSLCETGF